MSEGESPATMPESSDPSSPLPVAGVRAKPRVERFDLRILASLRRIVRASDLYSRKLESQYNITLPQLVCLLTIADEGPLTTSQLAERVFVSASTVVGIVDRLEERGFVRRERDAEDRRVVRVAITDSGKTLAGQAPSPLQDGLAHALKDLPELEQATIALSLERIVELMESRDLDGVITDHTETAGRNREM